MSYELDNGWCHLTKPCPNLSSASVRFAGYTTLPPGARIVVEDCIVKIVKGNKTLAEVSLPGYGDQVVTV